VFFVSIVVYMEINRRHYFRSGLHTFIELKTSLKIAETYVSGIEKGTLEKIYKE